MLVAAELATAVARWPSATDGARRSDRQARPAAADRRRVDGRRCSAVRHDKKVVAGTAAFRAADRDRRDEIVDDVTDKEMNGGAETRVGFAEVDVWR